MDRVLGDMEADNLDFATLNYVPRRAGEGDFCEVSYFIAKEEENGEQSLWRRRDPGPDPDPFSGGALEVVARGVAGLRFEYYDGFEWYDEWGDPEDQWRGDSTVLDPGNLSGIPEAVRVTLRLTPGAGAAKKSAPGRRAAEPELVFETIVRPHLAGAAKNSAPGGGSGGNGGGGPL